NEAQRLGHWLEQLSQAALQSFVLAYRIRHDDQLSMVELIAATRRVGDPLIFLNRNRPRYALGTHDSSILHPLEPSDLEKHLPAVHPIEQHPVHHEHRKLAQQGLV